MSDTGQSETFEPRPIPRSTLKSRVEASEESEPVTPERWFEPMPSRPSGEGGSASPGPDREPRPSVGFGLAALILATSLFSAVLAAGGTYLALSASGGVETTAAPADATLVSVEADTSTIVAAVAKVNKAVVQILANDGHGNSEVGAGVIFDVRGWVLTNKHIVEGMKTLTVRLADDRRVSGSIYGLDTLSDLAIVKLKGATDIWSAEMGDSSSLQVGQLAIAIGSPLGLAYPNSASTGIVSALGRDVAVAGNSAGSASLSLHGLIQTDAAVNPGNSGGPLVDASGRVIGITTTEAVSAQGLGFAVPIDIAKPIMQQALAGEVLSRPFLGVSYMVIDKGLQADYGLALDQGAWVHKEDSAGNQIAAVTSGSPAEAGGLKDGDIITSVEGVPIDGLHRLEDLLVHYPPGRTISVTVYRNGTFLTLKVTLGTRPDNLT